MAKPLSSEAGVPPGTKLVIEDRENPDGSWSAARRYLRFPDGSIRDLAIAALSSGHMKSNAGRSGASSHLLR
jgi:hypothetical protein